MAHAIASPRRQLRRNELSPDLLDIDTWPSVDRTRLDKVCGPRFDRLQNAVAMWLAGNPIAECAKCGDICVDSLYKILRRCLSVNPDGRIWGLRALIKGTHVYQSHRTNPLDLKPKFASTAGYTGMFSYTLNRYPNIATTLIDSLLCKGKKTLQPNNMLIAEIHKVFLESCRSEKISPSDYPFNTIELGRRALTHWIKTSFMEKYAIEYTRQSAGDSAANVMEHGSYYEGTLPDVPTTPYSEWQIDEYDVDVHTSFVFPALYGDWDELELSRFSGLRVIETNLGTNLAELVVFAAKPQMSDVLEVLWHAIVGQQRKSKLLNQDLLYDDGAGFPAAEIPELQWAVPSVIRLDRALIHLCDNVQKWVKDCWGGEVKMGRGRDPTERASVESKIGVLARRLLHQLPHTSYTGPEEARRRKKASDSDAPFIDAPLLVEAISVYCANENAHPTSGSGQISPLIRLRRLIQTGNIHMAYLPEYKRKRHFFSQPVRVTVRVDLDHGRRPFFIYKRERYSSSELQKRISWKGKKLWVRVDPHDLRTVMVFKENGEEFCVARAQGRWGVFPHDARIRQMYQSVAHTGAFNGKPQDRPMEALFAHLRQKAGDGDKRSARSLAYIYDYLGQFPGDLGTVLRAEMNDLEDARNLASIPLTSGVRDKSIPENSPAATPEDQHSREVSVSDRLPRRSVGL